MQTIKAVSVALLLIGILVGCGGGGGGSSPTTTTTTTTIPISHVPEISNLQYSPRSAVQNQNESSIYVRGSIDVIDKGGDVAELTINVYYTTGGLYSTDTIPVTVLPGTPSDFIQLTARVDTSLVVNYTFEIFVKDRIGNRSNTLSGTFSVTAPTDPLYAKTLLLHGKWHFVYTIISTWTDDYSLSTIDGSKNSQGGYYIVGKNQWGTFVNATYWPTDGYWGLFDAGIIIDKFYTFYTDGVTILANSCYYQIDKSTGNWSRCFSLSGIKTSQSPDMAINEDGASKILSEEELCVENTTYAPIGDDTKDKYLQLKNEMDQRSASPK